ncbi:hypothetical protein V3C99_018124 [Haemonchus contortus]|uniref:DUF5726 domain-containing protein n=1 Tax=Haemonchus contortus TaxID=6289 RepID=A0A7I4Z5S6_HAECO
MTSPHPNCGCEKGQWIHRLSADTSKRPNRALLLRRQSLPTAEDVLTKFDGRTVFSQINFAYAYLRFEVSRRRLHQLLTINLQRRLCRCDCLPFIVNSVSGFSQQNADSMIAGFNIVAACLHAVIVTGCTLPEHNVDV